MWVIVSWGIELDVCLRAVKTKHCLVIVMHFNSYLMSDYVLKDIFA